MTAQYVLGVPRESRTTSPTHSGWHRDLFTRQQAELGERLRALRRSRAWTQDALSERTGVDRSAISHIERGKQNVTVDVLWRLADSFHLDCAALLDNRTTTITAGSDHPPAPLAEQLATFSTHVYQARMVRRISRKELAARCGIGPSVIFCIEHEPPNLTLLTLSRLAAGLGMHWADLLGERRIRRPPLVQPTPDGCALGATDEDQRPRHVADELRAVVERHDWTRLATLSPATLEAQLQARRLLYDHLDQMCRDAQRRSLHQTTQWAQVAALRDLLQHLMATAVNVRMRRE
jgi:transcriptional regulator with XRE-family HTH domain